MNNAKGRFSVDISPDWQGFLRCLQRNGTPDRVFFIEFLLDEEIKSAVAARFGLTADVEPDDPCYLKKREVRVQRFLGYDYVSCGVDHVGVKVDRLSVEDSAGLRRSGGRQYLDLHQGPVTNWDQFNSYPWPKPNELTTDNLAWYQENLPENMCIIGTGGFLHILELMGFETLCYALHEQRDLVEAICRRLSELYQAAVEKMLRFDRVKAIFWADDMGFRSGTLIRPDDLREFILPAHKKMAELARGAGRPYLLHSCGNLEAIMDDLLDDVRIDGLHSFEDSIRTAEQIKQKYGHRIAVLGGIDVDFLCRFDEEAIRRRVRSTLEACQPGGGYCLGTGNSVTNYIPLDNYLVMLDEGRQFTQQRTMGKSVDNDC